MEEVTAEQVKEAVEQNKILSWHLRRCSMCQTQLTYTFRDQKVFFDGNCGCVSYTTELREHSYQHIADTLNMQKPHVRERMWNDLNDIRSK